MKTTHLTLLLLWLGISSFINGEFYFPETEALQAVAFSSGSPVQPYVRQYGLSPKQCVVECALRKRCAAFTYKRQYQRCDLLPVLDNVEEWTTMEEGLVMGNMTENTRNIVLEDCGIINCSFGEKCSKTENDEPECVISECEPLDIDPNMVQGSFLNYIGAKIQIHCTSNTLATPNSTIIECQSNGEWTAIPADFCNDDPCDDNWTEFNGDCYLIPDTLTTWQAAVKYCQLHLANVATVRSVEVHNFLAQTLMGLSRPGGAYWIGATQAGTLWRWYTDDAILVDDWFWHPTYPTGLPSDACAKYQMINDEMAWTNGDCNDGAFAICQKESLTADVTESPTTADSCTAPLKYFDEFCYYFVPRLYIWDEAEIFCEKVNSLLVIPSNEDEHDFIVGVLDELDRYPGNENLAEQRSTSQSSGVPGLDSFLAVDGVYDNNGLCWQSLEEDRPWWMVELDQEIAIHRVEINTKADCCGNEPQSLAVFAGPDKRSTPTYCGAYEGNVIDGITAILCEEGVVGTVVKVELKQFGILSFCEVQIFEVVRYSEAVNLALLRSSSHSSTFESQSADHAVDGIYSSHPELAEMSCAVTLDEDAPWWLVDLGRQYPVKKILIKATDPTTTSFASLQDIVVYVQETAHTDSSEHVCGSFLGPVWTDEPVNIVCGITMVGQFIKILRTSLGSLVLCEVEVYADETFSASYWIDKSPVVGVQSVPDADLRPRYEKDDEGFSIEESSGQEESYSICKKSAD